MRESSPKQPPLKLVVVEEGTHPSAPTLWSADEATELMVVVEGESEPPLDFALSTMRRIATLERSGRRVREVVILVSGQHDGQALAARCLLARAVLTHQMQEGQGELTFDAQPETDTEAQHELLSLAGVLMTDLGHSQISIRVRFADVRPVARTVPEADAKSGVFASARPGTQKAI